MFGRKKAVQGHLISPASGKSIPLESVNDEAFSEKMLGDGVALIPYENIILAPCSGTVAGIAKTAHAYNILSSDGLEILIHIGIDTVKLKGEGFHPKVSVGDHVKSGDPLCIIDLDFLKQSGFDTTTPIVISNSSDLTFFNRRYGNVTTTDTLVDYVL